MAASIAETLAPKQGWDKDLNTAPARPPPTVKARMFATNHG